MYHYFSTKLKENTVIYVDFIKDDKAGRAYKVAGEVVGEAIPYISNNETTSRWMLYGIIKTEKTFNYVEKYGWPKIIHQFTLKILFLIKNLLKVTLFSVKIL
ncbi:hypothetical protein [Spiroplasma endosymbiont of Amphimallon solstitiale]|uniref:hypothetical protein n=1 Tax=Spiroplasma endosymbiont of Amphimallon solstitiale TaxID=3066288 RepID=UPI00313CB391